MSQFASISLAANSVVPPLVKKEQLLVTPLPPRYRLRDLILGDYAYADDGERFVLFCALLSQ